MWTTGGARPSPPERGVGGRELDLLRTICSFISADRGWFARRAIEVMFEGFPGGDSDWRQLNIDAALSKISTRQPASSAFWTFATSSSQRAPCRISPATGLDTYGRSGAGEARGQFRDERRVRRVEYRGRVDNGLLGPSRLSQYDHHHQPARGRAHSSTASPRAGAGLRLLISKRSRQTCASTLDFKQG